MEVFKIKKRAIILTFLFLMLFHSFAFAGDTDFMIEIGDQDAFVIGKVTGFNDNLYSVHIEKVLMGEMPHTEIKVEKHPYDWSNPSIGKYYALSLDKINEVYKIKYGGYKADSSDYKTLKLDGADSDPGNIVGRIQEFINSGKFIEADKRVKEKKAAQLNENKAKEDQAIHTRVKTNTDVTNVTTGISFINFPTASVIAAIIFVAAVLLILFNRKHKKVH